MGLYVDVAGRWRASYKCISQVVQRVIDQAATLNRSCEAMLDCAGLLKDVSDSAPCGPALSDQAAYGYFEDLAVSPQRPDWAALRSKALSLAEASRDLKAWVWLTRASLAADGLPGLADGLELIAGGLDRYWDKLPPLPDDGENDPRDRFRERLEALAELGATSCHVSIGDFRGKRMFSDLKADLERAVERARHDDAAAAAERAREAVQAICRTFLERLGTNHDPRLGFDLVLEKLATIEPTPGASDTGVGDAPGSSKRLAVPHTICAIGSRSEVVRALDLIVAYYGANEPSSPIPLLIERAKRLVPLSFAEAVKELAPSGFKDLQNTTGLVEKK